MSCACSMLKKVPLPVTSQSNVKDMTSLRTTPHKHEKEQAEKDKLTGTGRQQAVYTLQGKYVYELLVGPGVGATDHVRLSAIAQGKCGNCLDYKSRKYPIHAANQCPYTTHTGHPRPDTPVHHPVAQIDGRLSYRTAWQLT